MATIRDPNPIKLGEFHTVELYRNHTVGYIILDDGEPINGSSQVLRPFKPNLVTCQRFFLVPSPPYSCFLLVFIQGKFQGLDLNEELYVGGYPNYTLLAKTAGIKSGFVGTISSCVHHHTV